MFSLGNYFEQSQNLDSDARDIDPYTTDVANLYCTNVSHIILFSDFLLLHCKGSTLAKYYNNVTPICMD